jgi:hypothetical protein
MDSLDIKYPTLYPRIHEIYLQKPNFIDSLPSSINGHQVIIITDNNQKSLYNNHGNKLIHPVLFPLTNDGNKLYITITPYIGQLKKHNHYYLSVSDGTTIYFRFDCSTQSYILDKVENWGI